MNITEIDRNFSIETNLPENDIAWTDAKSDAFVCYGLVKTEEGYTRMPRDIAREVNEGVGELATTPPAVAFVCVRTLPTSP